MIDSKNFFLLLLSFIIGICLTIFFLDYENLGFTNTNWFTLYDSKSDFLALKFFLNDKWRFPVGLNPNYGELKNSVVFSGAVPILSFIFKIFKNYLPDNFHFFSIWIIICFSLQYFFSYKIINYLTKNTYYSLIAAIFFVISPILIYRLGIHLTLSAHWIVLVALYLEISKDQKFLLFKKSFLLIISSLVHFYFTIILIIINLVFSIEKLYTEKNIRYFFKENLTLFIPLIFSMYLVGFFVIPPSDSLGFGYGFYKANLLTFFDSSPDNLVKDWSLFLPDISNSSGESEGFGYFGLGSLILFLILIFYIFINYSKIIKKNFIYVIFSLLFLIIAFSNSINFGSYQIINFELPIFLYAPLSIIRASGRLIWPVYYLILIFSLYALYKFQFKFKIFYVLILLLIQIIDLAPGINKNFLLKKPIIEKNLLKDPIWSLASNNFKNIISTSISNSSNNFPVISRLLIEEKFDKTNFFRLGRYNRAEASIYRSKLYKDLIEKKINYDNVYIVDNIDHLRHLKYIYKNSDHGFFNRNNVWILLPGYKSHMSPNDQKNLEMISYKKVKLNEKINIEMNKKDGILGMGWSKPSYGRSTKLNGSWTEGYTSSLLFIPNDKINFVKIIVEKIIFKDQDLSEINIFINDKKVEDIQIKKTNKIYINLKNKKLKDDVNIITFNVKNPITPFSLLESVDGRLLGLLVKEVEFK
jgi:hypothetical protein